MTLHDPSVCLQTPEILPLQDMIFDLLKLSELAAVAWPILSVVAGTSRR